MVLNLRIGLAEGGDNGNFGQLNYARMNPKPRPNHHQYLQTLRTMTKEQRLLKAFELSEFSRQLFKAGLRERFPEKTEAEIHDLFLKRLEKCHDRNY